MSFKTILILAGGQSTRFWPLSHKNLLPLQGKALLEHQLERYTQHSDNCVVVANEDTYEDVQSLASTFNVKVIHQSGDGQAAAVLSAKDQLNGETLIVNANDLYDEVMLQSILDAEDSYDGLFVSTKIDDYVPGGYLQLEGDQVTGVIEKPGKDNMPSPYWKFVVDYIKNIQDFIAVLENTSSGSDDVYEVGLSSYIDSGKKFGNVVYESNWATLKYPWHVLEAKEYLLGNLKSYVSESATVHESVILEGEVYIDDGAKVYEFSKIVGPAYIGKNVVVGNFALIIDSMIEEGSVIGGYSEVTRSYVGPKVWTHRSYIGDSVIEGPANFGAGSIAANLRFDKKNVHTPVKGEKTDTMRDKLGLIAGKNVEIGVNAATMPGIKVAPGQVVMPGSVAFKDIT